MKNLVEIRRGMIRKRSSQSSQRGSEVDTSQVRNPDIVNDNYLGLYSKGITHDATTMVADEAKIKELQLALETGRQSDFDDIDKAGARKQASPQACLSFELSGGDPEGFTMDTAPALNSRQAAAEMVEVYAKALLRDKAFKDYGDASQEVTDVIAALNAFGDDFLGPKDGGLVTAGTLFRGSSAGCLVGEYISQLLMHPIGVGNFLYEPQGPTKTGVYGISKANYVSIQNGNVPVSQTIDATLKYMYNGRQLGSTVHIDLVFQHFYEAAAILLNAGVAVGSQIGVGPNEANFIGGPVAVTTGIGEVARHALRAAWVQKWRKQLRLRPEATAARVVAELDGDLSVGTVHADLKNSSLVADVAAANLAAGGDNKAFLPLQYAEGSPTHPSYPAGHATIAGACATLLKIWFTDGLWSSTGLSELRGASDGLSTESVTDSGITIHGEIDKAAHNIAIGRNFAGVHYRSDSELALGEKVAIQYYKDHKSLFNEAVSDVTFTGFDGTSITV